MHFKWNYEAPTPEQQKAAKELGEKLNIGPILGQLLIQPELYHNMVLWHIYYFCTKKISYINLFL